MSDKSADGGSPLLSIEEARLRIEAAVKPVDGFELVAIRDALGRVTATPILAPMDVPGHANSAMDGYAIAFDSALAEPRHYRIIGTALAGAPYRGRAGSGETVRIMTGALLPEGADTVVMQEQARREEDRVLFHGVVAQGDHVRQAGEDLRKGEELFGRGRKLRPADIGLLASLGIPEVRVVRRVRVAFFSTGDELRSVGEAVGEGDIYDSNRYTLHAMLTRLGAEILDLGVVRDDREALREALAVADRSSDVVLTSGGVSVGEADYTREVLAEMGKVALWKIAMKPGKPLTFGTLGDALFFGLPGNPVSAMVTFHQIVRPALERLAGVSTPSSLRLRVVTSSRLKKSRGRSDFQRGLLYRNDEGELRVRSTGPQGSHILRSVSDANCFIILPAEWGDVEAGSTVEVEPFEGSL